MSTTGLTKDLINEYSLVAGKSYFSNYLIFPPSFNIRKLCNPDYVKVTFWRSIGISTEKIEPLEIDNAPEVNYSNKGKISIKFNNNLLIQQAFTVIYKK